MMKGSSYLSSTPKGALSRPRRFGSLSAVFLVFAVLLSSFATLPILDSILNSGANQQSKSSNVAINDASALWCSDPKEGNLGLGMDNRSDWKSGSAWYPHADTSGRVLTAQEAFGNGLQFTNFNGVGESPGLPWFWISPPVGLPETDNDTEEGLNAVVSYTGNTPEGEGTENWFKNMNSSRTPTKCVMGGIGASVANGILGITTGVTNLMGGISTFAFDPNFICDPDDASATNCLDLVGIIGGGGGSDEGIIGKLTTSVYFPLLTLAALLVGVWIVWNGLAKRQFRETLIGVVWSVVTVILGIVMLLNPLMLAKAPMVVGNALTSCIIGAFTGSGGCADGSAGTADSTETPYCVASSSKNNFMDKAAITMTSMSCELWKAFVLQPYAQGSFGAPLDQLDTNSSGTIAAQLVAKNPGFDANTFCVDTKVAGGGSLESRFGKTLNLTTDGSKICNLAVYQAYLGVDAKMDSGGGGDPAAVGTIDGRWLKLAQVAATDEGMYRAWAPSDLHLAQIGMAIIGLISAILAAVVVFVVAAFALAFYVTSILMIAFAPFFLLAGVHPGKGRKMMIGWIGQVLSNVMKYAASAIFLVITISLYGAVLSNVSNPGAILIFMIILTVALLMYRREIVDMVGVIDLGGEKLSNKFAEKTMDRVRNTGKTAMAVGAGVTAGALANGSMNPFSVANWNPENIVRNAGENIRAGVDSGRRNLKSRPGVIGEVMKASDRISADNRGDMAKQSTAAMDGAKKATQERIGTEKQYNQLTTELESSRASTEDKLSDLQDRNAVASSKQFDSQSRIDSLGTAQSVALGSVSNPAFREYQDLLNQMKNLEMKAVIAEESGLTGEAAAYRQNAESINESLQTVRSRLSDEDIEAGRTEYGTALASNVGNSKVTPENAERYEDHIRKEYQNVMATIGGTASKAERLRAQQEATEQELKASILDTREKLEDAAYAETNAEAAATMARERVIDLKPGQVVKNTDVRKNARDIAAMQNDRSREIHDLSSSVEDQMLTNAEAHVDATSVRDSWRETAAAEQARVADSQLAARRISDMRQDVNQAKTETLNSWRTTESQEAEAKARAAYIKHLDAERAAAQATAKREALSLKESSEGGLSELDKSDLFVARRQEETAREQMERTERAIRHSGQNLEAMKAELRRSVEAEYARTASVNNSRMDQGLESFERDLESAAADIQREIAERQSALQLARQNELAAARQAEAVNREAQRLASTAQNLRDQASSDTPVDQRAATRATSRAARTTDRATRSRGNGRGLPRLDDTTPAQAEVTSEGREQSQTASQPQSAQAPTRQQGASERPDRSARRAEAVRPQRPEVPPASSSDELPEQP